MKGILLASLLAAGCGAGAPEPSSRATAIASSSPAPVVSSPVKHIDVNGSSIDVLLLDAVSGIDITENGRPAAANVSTYTDDAFGIHADAATARYWRLGVAFYRTYALVVHYKGADFPFGPFMPVPNPCGGCVDVPTVKPATCSLAALDVSWADTRAASAADEDTATVTLRPGYTGTVAAFLSSYDGDGVKVHGPLAVTLPGAYAIHLAHRQTAGWRVELTCADGSLLAQAVGAW